MCGIALLLSPSLDTHDRSEQDSDETSSKCLCDCWTSVLQNVKCRGPDSFQQHTLTQPTAAWNVRLASSVLSLRGKNCPTTVQPLRFSQGEDASQRYWLCWNGQIFDWNEGHGTTPKRQLDRGVNDGQVLFDVLCSSRSTTQDTTELIVSTLALIEGPYAFVFIDWHQQRLVFGRDPLGRRSLLVCQDDAKTHLAILSVTSQRFVDQAHAAAEVSCASLWTLDLTLGPCSLASLPRNVPRLLLCELTSDVQQNKTFSAEQYLAEFSRILSHSVRQRVTSIETTQADGDPHLAILFSGGLDCTTLAALAGQHVPPEQPIDLLNVAFENPRAIQAAKRLKEREATKKADQKNKSRSRRNTESGLDYPAQEPLESKIDQRGQEAASIYDVPDRITGRASFLELCRLQPNRNWRFVEIDVPYSNYCEAKPLVEALMWPSSSVIDLSIASALYFASQSIGTLTDPQTKLKTPYTSQAKVLLSGLGADELLGGYSRHRAAFMRNAKIGLVQELQMDLDRLPERNLGRDDRVLSHHGKEARYPFLDRSVIEYLTSIPVETKIDLATVGTEGAGGDKAILRSLAQSLDLVDAARLKKRAMQFGTRVAKIDDENRHAKGHHSVR